MLFGQSLTLDRAQALWDLGRQLNRGRFTSDRDPDATADAYGHVLTSAGHGTPALAVDDEGRIFAVSAVGRSYVVRIGRISDGMFRPSEWAQSA